MTEAEQQVERVRALLVKWGAQAEHIWDNAGAWIAVNCCMSDLEKALAPPKEKDP